MPPSIFIFFISDVFRSGPEKPLVVKPSIIEVFMIVALEASIGWLSALVGRFAI